MGKKKDLDKCKSGKDFVRYAEQKDLDVRTCKSSHVVVSKPGKGAMTIPVHADEQLGVGIRRAIIAWFIAAGLGMFLCFASGLLQNFPKLFQTFSSLLQGFSNMVIS